MISGAGSVRGDEGPSLRAHSIRGFSTSAVFLQNWSVSKVLEAATWKSNLVFASFTFVMFSMFLKDCGPFVAVGTVVNPT